MIGGPTRYTFSISASSVSATLITFTAIFFLIYLNSVRQVRFANPIELVRAEKAGEKPPKANWLLGIAGLMILGAGYFLALKIQQPMAALMWFFVSVILINLIAFFVAYALTLKIRGSNVFRTVFFMPNLIGGIILGYIWHQIFDGLLRSLDMPSLVTNETLGFWGLVILMCWQQAGYMMIIYIAGFQSVPADLYEAAKIDGANKGQLLTNVTLPMMMPSITICSFLTLTNSFKLFDQNLALTGGAPLVDGVWTTRMMALNIYKTFYGEGKAAKGAGQAEGVIFFLIVVVISLVQLFLTRRKEVQA